MNVRLSARTDVGVVRDHNEDNFSIAQSVLPFVPWDYQPEGFDNSENGLILLVADGMGGANAGEVASSIVVNVMENAFTELKKMPVSDKDKEVFLRNSIHDAKKIIVKEAKGNAHYKGMGTTVVVAWVIANKCHLAWAGDSRAYRLTNDKNLEIISKDHSLVWELMEKGLLTEEEAENHPDSNIITQSLSDSGAKLNPDSKTIELADGDKLLLCSDGLNGMVSKIGIANILCQNQGNEACSMLVEEANRNGGTDNITVVLLEAAPFWSIEDVLEDENGYKPITVKSTIILSGDSEEKKTESGKNDINVEKTKTTSANQVSNNISNDDKKSKDDGFLKKIWRKLTDPTDEGAKEVEQQQDMKNIIEENEDLKEKD
ncbi:MAG: serine/threonine-protein phosphatase [Bacteroidetes bacterium]|nr:serine/threonine-protein phosphatase [Bacteroidota bacterium]